MGNSLGLCAKCWAPLDGAHTTYCKKCHAEYQRLRVSKDPNHGDKVKAWNDANRDKRLLYKRLDYLKRYGLTQQEALDLLARDDLKCEICLRDISFGRGGDKLAVDHDHETSLIRGYLCQDCNILIGKARESQFVLSQAITYLRRTKRKVS
jgi:hypothetical protein